MRLNLISKEHPKQKFLFFIAEEIDETKRAAVKQLVDDLASQRQWVIGPPAYLDIIEDATNRSGDMPDETLGGVLEIYAAYPPNSLPHEIDLLHLEEVEHVVKAVQKLSLNTGMEFEFELDGRFVGAVEAGTMDSSLSRGLLEEWRNQMNRRE